MTNNRENNQALPYLMFGIQLFFHIMHGIVYTQNVLGNDAVFLIIICTHTLWMYEIIDL